VGDLTAKLIYYNKLDMRAGLRPLRSEWLLGYEVTR
jgi:hypothetical protein